MTLHKELSREMLGKVWRHARKCGRGSRIPDRNQGEDRHGTWIARVKVVLKITKRLTYCNLISFRVYSFLSGIDRPTGATHANTSEFPASRVGRAPEPLVFRPWLTAWTACGSYLAGIVDRCQSSYVVVTEDAGLSKTTRICPSPRFPVAPTVPTIHHECILIGRRRFGYCMCLSS